MKFCPNCGTLMRPSKRGGKRVLVCPSCGYVEDSGSPSSGYSISSRIKHSPKDKIVVVDSRQAEESLPKLRDQVYCPKCGHNEVYYWVMQTRRADEPPTRFYKCVKCGHVWREYE